LVYTPFHLQSTEILFCFGSSSFDGIGELLNGFCQLKEQFAQYNVSFSGVCIDPSDRALSFLFDQPPVYKLLWDLDRKISVRYGACQDQDGEIKPLDYKPLTIVLDDDGYILRIFPVLDVTQHIQQVMAFVKQLPAFKSPSIAKPQAPVLFIPNVFNPAFCQHLIDLFQTDGGRESGFMKPVDDKLTEVIDPDFKRRRDFMLTDLAILSQVNDAILRRVKPEIEKAFQVSITNFERYVVACYNGENQGCFKLHRDNVAPGTTHRRFAMTLNLNAEYEGGYLRFPEYGPYLYRPGVGEAVIFSCSLLHEVTPVTRDRRFALLSFFYSDEDSQTRQEGLKHIVFDKPPNDSQTHDSQKADQGAKKQRTTRTASGFQTKK